MASWGGVSAIALIPFGFVVCLSLRLVCRNLWSNPRIKSVGGGTVAFGGLKFSWDQPY
jgi:hypothetical protein